MKLKIVVLDGNGLNPGDLSWAPLEALGDVTVYPATDSFPLTCARIGDAPIVFTNKTPITRSVLENCPQIQYIGELATGYNNIDLNAAKQFGITVTNVPSYGTQAVAQFTFALLLEVCHQVGLHNTLVHQGKWSQSPAFCFWDTPQMELAGKTMGIIGCGRIGTAVGKIAEAFGMKVLVYSRRKTEAFRDSQWVPLETLLAQSDVLSLHCPLTPETKGLIHAGILARIKPGAILLNTSRGGLIQEEAVAGALKSGQLGYYAADVAATEPLPADSPLLAAPNCILTPHMAWAATASRQRLLDTACENLRKFLAGSPQNVVI